MIEKHRKQIIESIRSCLEKGIRELKRVGELYVEAITNNPEMREAIQDAIPEISPSTWSRFELLGRGHAVAQLVYDDSLPAKNLLRCPLSEQEKYIGGEGFELLLDNGDILKVSLHNLTRTQTHQVFAKDHVRDIAEQKAWLKQSKSDPKPNFTPEEPAYVIVKKKVRFRKNTELNRKQVADILVKLA